MTAMLQMKAGQGRSPLTGKVFHRALRLCAIPGASRHTHLTERIALDPNFLHPCLHVLTGHFARNQKKTPRL